MSGIEPAASLLKGSLAQRLRASTRLRGFVRRLRRSDSERVIRPSRRNGMVFEAEEVVRCLQRGETQSQVMPLDESLRVMRAVDYIRRDWQSIPKKI